MLTIGGHNGWANPHDTAVLILAEQPDGITPAQLPTVGEFDHIAHDATFTVVGRGSHVAGSAPCPLAPSGVCGRRDITTLRFQSLQPFWVRVSP